MDGGGELIGMIAIDPVDVFPLRQLILRGLSVAQLDGDLELLAEGRRMYVQLGGDPENLK